LVVVRSVFGEEDWLESTAVAGGDRRSRAL
jgi:hypothetical protein